jgi:hypothetical protein
MRYERYEAEPAKLWLWTGGNPAKITIRRNFTLLANAALRQEITPQLPIT